MFVPLIITTISVIGVTSRAVSSITNNSNPSTYRAAVYEHKPFLPDEDVDTRREALALMERNLDVYGVQTNKAKRLGAQIIVFPENGIYGWRFPERTMIASFLEKIPDPKVTQWSPCSDPTRFADTEVQHALSCMAQENKMYVVANMADSVPCNQGDDPKCPSDGHYQYNTDVAYDPDGNLVARYHKVNLYFEPQFDTPDPEVVYFDTPFGRFGMLVCFDLLFRSPAEAMLTDHTIANIAYTTAWMDALPMLSAVGYHSSFARGAGVNFLSANIHSPSVRAQGSGIYTPNGVAKYYYNNDPESPGKLLVSSIEILSSNRQVENEKVTSKNIANPSNNTGDEFFSSLLHDQYTFRLLKASSGKVNVCHRDLCCSLSYTISNDCKSGNELFSLGAFDDLHTHNGRYYLQTCALVKCGNNKDKMSCGHYTFDSNTEFKSLSLTGTFKTKYVYPQVVMIKKRQLRLGDEASWSFKDNTLKSQGGLNMPLLTAALLGRHYSRD